MKTTKTTHLMGSLLLLSLTWSTAAYAANPSINLDGGKLTIRNRPEGTTPQQVTVKHVGTRLHVFYGYNHRGTISVVVTPRIFACAYSDVEEIYFLGSDQDDDFANETDIPVEAHGGNGKDILRGGSGDDKIMGGGGDDRIWGNDGDDILGGGDGEDELFGGAGNDVLSGHRGPDYLYGGEGNDTLVGGRGHDHLSGGPGDDNLQGGRSKNDYCNGGDGENTLTSCEKHWDR